MESQHESRLEAAFEEIEGSILPSLSLLLDSLIETAAAARPGIDAAEHAAQLRAMAFGLDDVTRRIEELAPAAAPVQAPERVRISA